MPILWIFADCTVSEYKGILKIFTAKLFISIKRAWKFTLLARPKCTPKVCYLIAYLYNKYILKCSSPKILLFEDNKNFETFCWKFRANFTFDIYFYWLYLLMPIIFAFILFLVIFFKIFRFYKCFIQLHNFYVWNIQNTNEQRN